MQLVFSDPELLAAVGPRVRKSPFFEPTVAAGLSAVSCYNHMWLPMSYGDPDAEYRRLTEAVSLWDVAAQRHLQVRGRGADRLVQHLTAVDTSTVEIGTGCYAPITDHRGILINDPILLHTGRDEWRFSLADADIGLWATAIAHERSADCDVRELDTATLALQGPNADAVLDELGLDGSDLSDLSFRPVSIDGVQIVISRSGWSSQGGYEMFLDDPRNAGRLWENVMAAGETHGIGPGTPNPSERIENTLLSYGTDTGYDADPFELGLGDVVDLDGDDFVGRDALLEIREAEPRRELVGVVVAGPRLATLAHPIPVSSAAEVLGELRAAAWSPRFGVNLGLALMRTDLDDDLRATAIFPEGIRDLRLADLPFEVAAIERTCP